MQVLSGVNSVLAGVYPPAVELQPGEVSVEEEWPTEGRCAHPEDHVPISVDERHGKDLGLCVGVFALLRHSSSVGMVAFNT